MATIDIPAVITAKPLKPKQQAFVDAYMTNGRNATQAAISADYSVNGAKQRGYALLQEPGVAAEIARRVDEYSRSAGITAVAILERLKVQAFTDITEFLGPTGGLKAPGDWAPGTAAAVHSYDAGGAQSSEKIRLHDQPKILLELLDRVAPIPRAPAEASGNVTNVQINVDKLMLALPHASLPAQ